MKTRAERSALTKALRTVSVATPKTTGRPVLSGVRLDGDGKHLKLTCTNLDLTITATIDAQAEGSAIAPAGLLSRIVSAMGSDVVSMKLDDLFRVECGDTLAEIHSLPLDEWPKLEAQDGAPVEFDSEVWGRLGRVVPFAWPDNQRPPFDCVQFKDGRANVTDSYRAATVELGVSVPEALVPASSLAAVLRVAEPPVTFTVGQHTASFTSSNITWTTRLVVHERGYPDLSKFARKTSAHRLTFPSAALLEAIERLSLISGGDGAKIVVQRDGDKAMLSSSESDVGSLTDVVACEGTLDERIGFHPKYLRELVEAAACDEFTIGLEDSRKVAVATSDGMELILMPVNLL